MVAAMAEDRLGKLLEFYRADPEDAFTRFALAQEYAKHGELVQAQSQYEDLVATAPEYTGTYYHLGKLYLALGKHAQAARVFRLGMDVAAREGQHRDLAELREALETMDTDDG